MAFAGAGGHSLAATAGPATATPIKHLVVIFQENVSFDHYFGTYPHAANPAGEPAFRAAAGTPKVNGLTRALLTANPNTANPQRLDRSQALTCDQDHDYTAEQKAFHRGLMDKFVQNTQVTDCTAPEVSKPGLVMDYYDGNTVTGLWNYAQHFAMSDNSYGTTFGPSTPGAINLVSGQTHGGYAVTPTGQRTTDPYVVASPNAKSVGTVINDPDPAFDDCSSTAFNRLVMTGTNIGDLLNRQQITWGFFQGGFRPSTPYRPSTGTPAVCASTHNNIADVPVTDYSPHHQPFEYYKSTANPHHLPPSSVGAIGRTDRANHQYDLTDFTRALDVDNLPAVSFVKAAKYQDGHAGYSDPLDEQHFVVNLINRLQSARSWKSTAVVIAYDDSDGWYDHQMSPILNNSQSAEDALTSTGRCGNGRAMGGYADRCGYGPRLPLLVISPYARPNTVDHSITDQTSILRFVEYNWLADARIGDHSFDQRAGNLNGLFNFHGTARATPLYLSPRTGEPPTR
ncbi:MAG: alkaline phosphatase family protein [Actinomycetota bacterium]|nr:alkaline phosphatase family protein [Actinomycetota bacterium]